MKGKLARATANLSESLPLVVDLDGTLCNSDTLVEAVFNIIRRKFFLVPLLPFWLLLGKVRFKRHVFLNGSPDPALLPFNEDFLMWIKAEKARGRQLTLATASPDFFARKVGDYLGIFSEVKGSDHNTNLRGNKKAAWCMERFGKGGFVYAANALSDTSVWRVAGQGVIVRPSGSLLMLGSKMKNLCPVVKVFPSGPSFLSSLMKEMRVYQWAKNLLIFSPLLLSSKADSPLLALLTLIAFLSFSMVSSSVYLLNDIMDLDADRQHPKNKKRPFASGNLSLIWGVVLIPFLLVAGLATAHALSSNFFLVVFSYYCLTTAYSLVLKKLVLADVITLACLYTSRIFAGGVVIGIGPSAWLLTFSGFVFLSLALLKRCSEIRLMESYHKKIMRRGYRIDDLGQISQLGTASGYLSVLVFALYLNSQQVTRLYYSPGFLWLICPLLLYWISRMWLKSHRGEMHSDPLVFTLKDKGSYVVVLLMLVIWIVARTFTIPF